MSRNRRGIASITVSAFIASIALAMALVTLGLRQSGARGLASLAQRAMLVQVARSALAEASHEVRTSLADRTAWFRWLCVEEGGPGRSVNPSVVRDQTATLMRSWKGTSCTIGEVRVCRADGKPDASRTGDDATAYVDLEVKVTLRTERSIVRRRTCLRVVERRRVDACLETTGLRNHGTTLRLQDTPVATWIEAEP
ncbi:MAG: hypothetical protein HY815_05260 [Candidatus Riflebacteria bacterium]|nr:hypothetical protein [Candidatus Riflebacteria bacterium]